MRNWKSFWQNYRVVEIKTKEDLLYQVGKTVGGKVIPSNQFKKDIDEIVFNLSLNKNDVLLDLCCGNGILSYQLSSYVKQTIGIDFSKIYIENANKYCKKDNIDYREVDLLNSNELKKILNEYQPNKILMNDCLAYFEPNNLKSIVSELSELSVTILMSGILDQSKKWKFYNTLKRKLFYLADVIFFNNRSGIGYWWTKKEITTIADDNKFKATFFEHYQENHMAHYRFNAKLEK